MQISHALSDSRVLLDQRADSRTLCDGWREVVIAYVGGTTRKDVGGIEAEGFEQGLLGLDLCSRDTAHDVSTHVMGFGWRCIVDVATDIEVVVVGRV